MKLSEARAQGNAWAGEYLQGGGGCAYVSWLQFCELTSFAETAVGMEARDVVVCLQFALALLNVSRREAKLWGQPRPLVDLAKVGGS